MTTLTTLELTPNAIALLLAGTDGKNIEKTLFHCYPCNLYYCWADLEYHQFDRECGSDLCPRCGSQDLATGDESFPSPNRFTFLGKNGSRRVLTGSSPDEALSNAGYSAGAIATLEFYAPGDDNSWQWRDGSGRLRRSPHSISPETPLTIFRPFSTLTKVGRSPLSNH